jgi:catechol 2,3-dioxygenase-like lactoylglutathione lyase family enzyme
MDMARATLSHISPFFVVGDVARSIGFYRDRLGFEVTWSDPPEAPFTAILVRDGAQLFVKSEGGIAPAPNSSLHRHLRWDAFVYTADPDALAAECMEREAPFSKPLEDTSDGLRGFEVTDPDGYVLFFGRPR